MRDYSEDDSRLYACTWLDLVESTVVSINKHFNLQLISAPALDVDPFMHGLLQVLEDVLDCISMRLLGIIYKAACLRYSKGNVWSGVGAEVKKHSTDTAW